MSFANTDFVPVASFTSRERAAQIRVRLMGGVPRPEKPEPPALLFLGEIQPPRDDAPLVRDVIDVASTFDEEPVQSLVFTPRGTPKIAEIIKHVQCLGELTGLWAKNERRWVHLVRARHVAFFVGREFTALSYPQIGRAFGDKDHTTIMHGCRVVDSVVAAMGISPSSDWREMTKTLMDIPIMEWQSARTPPRRNRAKR